MRTVELVVDELDYCSIQEAIAKRQTWMSMPDDDGGNAAGKVVAEICRGWLEFHETKGL